VKTKQYRAPKINVKCISLIQSKQLLKEQREKEGKKELNQIASSSTLYGKKG